MTGKEINTQVVFDSLKDENGMVNDADISTKKRTSNELSSSSSSSSSSLSSAAAAAASAAPAPAKKAKIDVGNGMGLTEYYMEQKKLSLLKGLVASLKNAIKGTAFSIEGSSHQCELPHVAMSPAEFAAIFGDVGKEQPMKASGCLRLSAAEVVAVFGTLIKNLSTSTSCDKQVVIPSGATLIYCNNSQVLNMKITVQNVVKKETKDKEAKEKKGKKWTAAAAMPVLASSAMAQQVTNQVALMPVAAPAPPVIPRGRASSSSSLSSSSSSAFV